MSDEYTRRIANMDDEIDELQAEVARLTDVAARRTAEAETVGAAMRRAEAEARLLAERTPRPVPEGEVCPAGYFTTAGDMGTVNVHADICASHMSTESACDEARDHRDRIGRDCFPDLAARIEALEAENADLVATVAEMQHSRDNDPTWKKIDALAEKVLAAEAAAQAAPSPTVHEQLTATHGPNCDRDECVVCAFGPDVKTYPLSVVTAPSSEPAPERRRPKWCDSCGVVLDYCRSGFGDGDTAYDCEHDGCDNVVCFSCVRVHDDRAHGVPLADMAKAAAPSSEPAPDIDEKVEQRVFLRCVAAHGHDGPHLYASTDHPSARGGIGEPRCVTYSHHQENFDRECRPIPTNPEHEAAIDALVADRLAGRAVTRMAPAEPEVVWTDEGEATAFGIPLAYNRTTDDFGTDVPMTVHEVFIGGDEQDGASICASTEATAKRLAVAVAREMQRG